MCVVLCDGHLGAWDLLPYVHWAWPLTPVWLFIWGACICGSILIWAGEELGTSYIEREKECVCVCAHASVTLWVYVCGQVWRIKLCCRLVASRWEEVVQAETGRGSGQGLAHEWEVGLWKGWGFNSGSCDSVCLGQTDPCCGWDDDKDPIQLGYDLMGTYTYGVSSDHQHTACPMSEPSHWSPLATGANSHSINTQLSNTG